MHEVKRREQEFVLIFVVSTSDWLVQEVSITGTSYIINSQHGPKFFQTLDFSRAYLRRPLHPETSDLNALGTRRGQFKFTKPAVGRKLAPSAFAQLVILILDSLQ